MKVLRVFVCMAILGGLLSVGFIRPAAAQTQKGAVKLQVAPAFDGYFKNGEWLAAWAEIENSGKNVDARLSVQITNSATYTTYAVDVSLPSGARKRVPLYILANNFSRELEVQLNGPDGLLASQKITVRPQASLTYLTGLVARERGGLALLNGLALPGQERPKVIVDLALEDLPERMEGLRSFDLLVLNDVDTSRLTPAQTTALTDWVYQGGRLVIGGGNGAALTLTGLPAELLPVTLDGQAELEAGDLGALVDFAGGSAIRTSGTFVNSKIKPVDSSRLLAGDLHLPLVVENRLGEGRVDFITLNLSSAPFNSWPDTIRFWNRLLGSSGEYSQDLPADISARQMYGMDMVNNLSNIPALDLPSIQWLSVLLAVYILLVGPVNYFVLRRLRRLQLAWLTIPLLTLVFSAGAFGIGYLMHGSDAILNQIALISPNGSGSAAVTNYLGLFSPSQSSYSLDVNTSGLLSSISANDSNNWGSGQPQALGGSNVTFVQGDKPRINGLSIDQWSFQSFTEEERWSQFGSLKADLRLENERVVGTLRNETHTVLTDIIVLVGSNFVRLGTMAAGTEMAVTLNLSAAPNRMGMPLSFQIYESQSNLNPGDSRQIDLKRNLVSRLVDGSGSKFSSFSKGAFSVANSSSIEGYPSATLIAWTDQVPPEVMVEGTLVKKQVIGLVTQKAELKLGESDTITLPAGMIPGSVTQAPVNGGICGNGGDVNGVMITNGTAEFKYQLPGLANYRVKELRLFLSQDSPQPATPGIALYDGSTKSWVAIKNPLLGVNTIDQPGAYIDATGSVRVQMSANSNMMNSYCTYLDLGLVAEKDAQSGGQNVGR